MDDDTRRRAREICALIGGTDCSDVPRPCDGGSCYIMELIELGQADARAEMEAAGFCQQ